MNKLDEAKSHVDSLQKIINDIKHYQEIKLNKVEIERLYQFVLDNPDQIVTVKLAPTPIGPCISAIIDNGIVQKLQNITDYESL